MRRLLVGTSHRIRANWEAQGVLDISTILWPSTMKAFEALLRMEFEVLSAGAIQAFAGKDLGKAQMTIHKRVLEWQAAHPNITWIGWGIVWVYCSPVLRQPIAPIQAAKGSSAVFALATESCSALT